MSADWVAGLDILAALGAAAALGALLKLSAERIGAAARGFLAIALLLYLFVGVGNALEHLGVTAVLDPYEDLAEILFFPLLLFFFYAAWVWQEMARRRAAEEDLKQLNEALRTVQQINQLIMREEAPERLVRGACEVLADTGDVHGAWIAVLDDTGKAAIALQAGLGEEFDVLAEAVRAGRLPPCARQALDRRGVIAAEINTDLCRGCPFGREGAALPALAARLEHADRVWGVLVVYGESGIRFHDDETPLLQELADDLGLALHKLELEEERRRLEAQFVQAQKMEAVGRLAGGIAHDFRNELTVIGGYCDLLLRDAPFEGPQRGPLEEIQNAARRAETLTSRLLAYGRKQPLQPQVVNVNRILDGIVKPIESMLGDDVELVPALAEDLGQVKVDPGQLEQAVMNLITNARDAMPSGGTVYVETANVELDAGYARLHPEVSPGQYVMLAVSDTGVGMDEQTSEQVFEPFFTTKRRGQGTGLGLSMVYGFIKQSGGSVFVYSEPGRGTTFKLYLPRVDAPAEAPEAGSYRAATLRGSGTILVVEDNDAVRGLVSRVLRECGYRLLEAGSAEEAESVAAAHAGPIDLLLSDVVLPGKSGPELAETLRSGREDLAVLLVSGYTGSAVARHGVTPGDTDLLSKPLSPVALARAVRQALEQEAPAKREG